VCACRSTPAVTTDPLFWLVRANHRSIQRHVGPPVGGEPLGSIQEGSGFFPSVLGLVGLRPALTGRSALGAIFFLAGSALDPHAANKATPIVMLASATLKTGNVPSEMKSVTVPRSTRSIRLPMAPPSCSARARRTATCVSGTRGK
jgi:hypothetical protein